MFESIERLRETAVRLGLLGSPPEQGMTSIQNCSKARKSAIDAQFAVRLEPIKERLKSLENRREQIGHGPKELERLRVERLALEARRAEIREELAALRARAITRRRRERAQHWQEVHDRYRLRLEQAPFEELEEQAYAAREIARIRRETWEIDRGELERRRTVLEQELSQIAIELEAARNQIELLKQRHLTRTSSGFLLWAGYATLAAVGAITGHLLQLSDGRDPLAGALEVFAERIGSLSPNAFAALGLFMVLVLGSLITIGLVVWLTDYLLQKFDRGWKPASRRKKGHRVREERSAAQSSSLLGLPRGEVRRGTYVQLIASFPLVFVAALCVFFLTWGRRDSANVVELTRGLASSYLGTAFALLVASAFVLYTVYVIWPRYFSAEAGSGVARASALRRHGEIMLLFALVPCALFGAATVGEFDRVRLAWIPVGLFMVAGGFGLAQGVVSRGFFRDYDVLARRRARLLYLIEALNTQPLLGGEFLRDLGRLQDLLEEGHKQQGEFDLLSLVYWDPDREPTEDYPSFSETWFWLQRGRRLQKDVRYVFRKVLKKRAKVRQTEEPESEDPRWLELRQESARIEVRLQGVQGLIALWEAGAGPRAWADVESAVAAAKAQYYALEAERLRDLQLATNEVESQTVEFQAAYNLGVHTRLRLGLSSGPTPPSSEGGEDDQPTVM